MINPVTLIRYYGVYKKYIGRRIILVFVLSFLATLVEGIGITLVIPLLASLDPSFDTEASTSGLHGLINQLVSAIGISGSTTGIILFIAFLIGLKACIRLLSDGYGTHLTAQLRSEVTARMFKYYSTMDYSYYTARNTGHFTSILNGQIPQLINSFGAYKTLAISAVTTIGYIVFAFFINWHFALMACVAGGIVLFLFRALNNYTRELSRRTANERRELNKLTVQSIQSFKYAASTGSLKPMANFVNRSIALLARYQRNQGFLQAFTAAFREPISIGLILIILIIQIAFLEAPLAPIFVSLILLYRAMGSIMVFQGSIQNFLHDIGSVEMVEKEFAEVANAQEPDGSHTMDKLKEGIQLKDVSFQYSGSSSPILRNISLSVPARHTVALIGPSGAGKSTLVDLLTLLLKPTKGSLTIDGHPHADILKPSWRKQIGYVSQDTVIFDDTISNNIGLWQGSFDTDPAFRERVLKAAEKANIHSFIETLPEGYHTRVGDRGVRLSGGQKQRLFIARELFKVPSLLILDEATSALDSESEQAIQQSIDNLKGQTTIVIIAHRLSTIKGADQVYVLEAGEIVESGSYESLLMNTSSRLNQMVELQKH
ncbi:MAG: ABC transporter ATP-binding protein [Opitutales bacterium]|nr:ABC transporter ATP-binding protein [Opitutales bacterium]